MLNLKFTEVKRFNRAAVAHRDAAKALLDKCPLKGSSTLGHEVVYLSGYVVECALKALLLAQYPQREHAELVAWFKSDLKHNLEWLKGKLAEKGVNFPREQKENLRRLRRQDEGWSPKCGTPSSPGGGMRPSGCFSPPRRS